jgi:hypothetical protein
MRTVSDVYGSGRPQLPFTPLHTVGNVLESLADCTHARELVDTIRLARNARKQMDAQFTAIDRQFLFWITLVPRPPEKGI